MDASQPDDDDTDLSIDVVADQAEQALEDLAKFESTLRTINAGKLSDSGLLGRRAVFETDQKTFGGLQLAVRLPPRLERKRGKQDAQEGQRWYISPDRLRVANRRDGLVCSFALPIAPALRWLPDDGIRFEVSDVTLNPMIFAAGVQGPIRIEADVDRCQLTFSWLGNYLRFPITPLGADDPDIGEDVLPAVEERGGTQFSPRVLASGLSMAVKMVVGRPGDSEAFVSADRHSVRGIGPEGIAAYENPLLPDVKISVPKRNVRDLCSVLLRLRSAKGLVISHEGWLGDGNFFCRFPVLSKASPDLDILKKKIEGPSMAINPMRAFEIAGYLSILPKRLKSTNKGVPQRGTSVSHAPMVQMQVVSPTHLQLEVECAPILTGYMKLGINLRQRCDRSLDEMIGQKYTISAHVLKKAFSMPFDNMTIRFAQMFVAIYSTDGEATSSFYLPTRLVGQ